jgi:hypothetical protein
MNETLTSNWSEFGYREIEEAKKLLSHIKEIDSYGEVKVFFNKNSGFVFLSDDDFKVWLMDGDKIREWFNCPNCGHEGFREEFKDQDCADCKRIYKENEGK